MEYPRGAINVYDCNNLTVVKDVIPLPTIFEDCMEACNVSNCVYIGPTACTEQHAVISESYALRKRVSTSLMPHHSSLRFGCQIPILYTLSVTADGHLIFSRQQKDKLPVVCF